MQNLERLKQSRDILFKLHKELVDQTRADYENLFGPTSSGQFLNALLNDVELSWLRRISGLIVEIDEYIALKDGFESKRTEELLNKIFFMANGQSWDDFFEERIAFYSDKSIKTPQLLAELRAASDLSGGF
jgi:hypothetical protein